MSLARIAPGLIALGFISVVDASTMRVPQNFATIQAAVDAAAPGDTVLVGPGHYVEFVTIGKSLRLQSEAGAMATVIDGNGKAAPVAIAGTRAERVIVSGFTLTGGAHLLEPPDAPTENTPGSGLFVQYVASAVVTHNIFVGNRGCHGSGIVTYAADVVVSDNAFLQNEPMDWCPYNGMAVRLIGDGDNNVTQTAVFNDNSVLDNPGGGLSMTLINGASVRGNTISRNGQFIDGQARGRAIDLFAVGGVVAANYVSENIGVDGTALTAGAYPDIPLRLLVTANRFVDNQALDTNGGVWISSYAPSRVSFVGNMVRGDVPGNLVYCDGDSSLAPGNIVINRNPAGTGNVCLR